MDVSAYGSDWKQPNNEDGAKKKPSRNSGDRLKRVRKRSASLQVGGPP